MSQRLSLFHAGYCALAPAHYYAQTELARQHASHDQPTVREQMAKIQRDLEADGYEPASNLQVALSVANSLELDGGEVPGSAEAYFKWLPQYIGLFEEAFPMSKIDHYYFLFGRKLGEITSNLKLAAFCLDLDASLNKALDLSKRTDKCIKDNEYILFKLIAPAALLSSEPRHLYFNQYYKRMNAAFEPFRGINVDTLDAEGMKKLCGALRAFENEVNAGFRECVRLLKELEV